MRTPPLDPSTLLRVSGPTPLDSGSEAGMTPLEKSLDGFEVYLDERGARDAVIELVQGALFGADGMKDPVLFGGILLCRG